jgi:hypothetical protein
VRLQGKEMSRRFLMGLYYLGIISDDELWDIGGKILHEG